MRKNILTGLPALCFLALLSACTPKETSTPERVATVRIDTVRPVGGERRMQYPGRVVAGAEANLSFKVAGTLKHVYVGEGDRVKAGQLLAELDASDYRVQLAATEAEHAQVKADAERVMALYREGGTTASNHDKARYGLQQMEAKLQNHRNQVAYTRIHAPYDGQVQTTYFATGETVGAGMPVLSLLGQGTPEVEVNLPATAYARRSGFTRFACTLDVLPGETLPLQLLSILPQANANQLYTMRLRLKEEQGRVAPGMSVWVTVYSTQAAAPQVAVPATALVEKDGKAWLYLYNKEKGTARRTEVKVETLHTDGRAIVRGELHGGDLVVASGAHHIQHGARVRPLAPISTTNVGGLL